VKTDPSLTFDITHANGVVIVENDQVRIDLSPEQAKWFAECLKKHSAQAAAQRNAKVLATSGGKR
jgi:hypothetical protein